MSSQPAPGPRALVAALAGLAALALGVGVAFWPRGGPAPKGEPPPPPDPRLSYEGPFENVRPEVAYVGDRACASCHRDIARTYRRHPMGRSLVPFTGPTESQPLDAAHHHPFHGLGVLMQVQKKGGEWLHVLARVGDRGEEVARLEQPVRYTIGSATRGSSYLSVRDGFVFQTAISWFSQKGIWDTSPGFGPIQLVGRPVLPDCLFCHSNRFTPVPDTLNRYREPIFQGHAIGCERCHGPGERHAAEPGTGYDPTIVNPARLRWQLRENVCEQCHLQGASRVPRRGREPFDWRPGLPLEAFLSVHVEDNPDSRKAVNHVEQMRASRCFQASPEERKLGCVSCHDPHEKPSRQQRVAFYRGRCLSCHESRGCSLPAGERERKAPGDSCFQCHMPRYGSSDVVHTSVTDHTVPRRPLGGGGKPRRYPAKNFYADRLAGDAELGRDLGISTATRLGSGHPLHEGEAERGAAALEEHLREVPSDLPAREALGDLCRVLDRPFDAQQHLEAVLERSPRREWALFCAALAAGRADRKHAALGHWKRLVEVSPHNAFYRDALARALVDNGRHEEAAEALREWLRLDPTSLAARSVLFSVLLHLGRVKQAGEELAVLRRMSAPDLGEMERAYAAAGGRR